MLLHVETPYRVRVNYEFVKQASESIFERQCTRGRKVKGRDEMGRKVPVVDARSSRKTETAPPPPPTVRGNPESLWVFASVCKKRKARSATRGRS